MVASGVEGSRVVQFTKFTLYKFKKRYEKAVSDKEEVFTFNGNQYVTPYAKYLIEYMEGKFNG